MSVNRQRRLWTSPAQQIASGATGVFTWDLGGPTQGTIWLIEAVTVQGPGLVLAANVDSQTLDLEILPVENPSAGVLYRLAHAEGFFWGATLPIRAPLPIQYGDDTKVRIGVRNDSGQPTPAVCTFYVQLLEVTVDDALGNPLQPQHFGNALQV